jgi:hypothetical protein
MYIFNLNKLASRGEVGHSGGEQRGEFSSIGVNFSPGSQTSRKWGSNFTPGFKLYSCGSNFTPGGQTLPLEVELYPGGQTLPLRAELHPWRRTHVVKTGFSIPNRRTRRSWPGRATSSRAPPSTGSFRTRSSTRSSTSRTSSWCPFSFSGNLFYPGTFGHNLQVYTYLNTKCIWQLPKYSNCGQNSWIELH